MSEDGVAAGAPPVRRSPREVVEADAVSPMGTMRFDDALYRTLCRRIRSGKDLESHPPAVRAYFATRMIEWEIGNGGVSAAVDYAGDYLDMAAAGYRLLGQEHSAELVERIVRAETDEEQDQIMDAIGRPPWNRIPWADAERIALVRANRDQFLID